MIFDEKYFRKLTLKLKVWHILTSPRYTNSQSSKNSVEYVDLLAKILPILYPPLENSTTGITISCTHGAAFKFANVCTYLLFREHLQSKLASVITSKSNLTIVYQHCTDQLKLYIPRTLNTDIIFWQLQWIVFNRISNHGLNHGLFLSLFKVLGENAF